MKHLKRMLAIMSAFILAVVLVGCADKAAAAPQINESTCFTQLDAAQQAQLDEYARQKHDTLESVGDPGTFCILEDNGNGQYAEHYYSNDDRSSFPLFFAYAMMSRHSAPWLGAGLVTGAITPYEYMALSLMTNVNGNGIMYRPYACTDAGWGRNTTIINNVKVTNVYYGKDKSKKPPSASYAPTKLTIPTDSVKNVTRDASGKTTVTPVNASAGSVLASAKRLDPTKSVAPALTIPNPSKATTTTSAPTTPSSVPTTAPSRPSTTQPVKAPPPPTANPKASPPPARTQAPARPQAAPASPARTVPQSRVNAPRVGSTSSRGGK